MLSIKNPMLVLCCIDAKKKHYYVKKNKMGKKDRTSS